MFKKHRLFKRCFLRVNINLSISLFIHNIFSIPSGNQAFCPTNDSNYFINLDGAGQIKDCNAGSQVCKNGVWIFFNNADEIVFKKI